MANSKVHPEGWISLFIAPKFEDRAKQIRATRDLQYGNIFAETATDMRWVGDLGEIVFDSWFKHEGIRGLVWVEGNAAGQPDFVTEQNVRIGVKTVKRQGRPYAGYTAQVTARHGEEPVEQFFFMTYEISQSRMWLLGGIDRERFLKDSRYYGPGEWVHEKYQVRPDQEIRNIGIDQLLPPKEWLKTIR